MIAHGTAPAVVPPRPRRYTDRALCEKFRQCDGGEHRLVDHLVDRMWGLCDEDGHDRGDLDLRAAARRVCEVCPVRTQCLAEALVNQEQIGLYGGLDYAQRKRLSRLAESEGLTVRDQRLKGYRSYYPGMILTGPRIEERKRLLADWIDAHPDVLDTVRRQETEARRERRNGSDSTTLF